MAKFGELIGEDKPVLIEFYANSNDVENKRIVLRNVASTIGNKVRVIRINIAENKALKEALDVQELPTFMIYKKGEMKWRKTGFQDDKTLIGLVLQYV